MQSWACTALKPWLLDLSANRSFIESSVWNGPTARAAVERAVDGKASIDPVWPILNAYVLEQAFKVQARTATPKESAGCLRSRSEQSADRRIEPVEIMPTDRRINKRPCLRSRVRR